MANPKGNPETLKSYKPKWRSGKTRTIRVPIALADETLEYARKRDRGENLSTDTSDIDKDAIINIARIGFSTKSNSGGKIKQVVADILAELEITAVQEGRKWIIK